MELGDQVDVRGGEDERIKDIAVSGSVNLRDWISDPNSGFATS